MNPTALIVIEDVATAASGFFNAGYFARYWVRAPETRARRIGAAALVAGGLAAIMEAVFSQALYWAGSESVLLGVASGEVWALSRLPLLAATLFISGIVLRRVFS